MDRKTFCQKDKNAEHRYCNQSSFEISLSSRRRKLKQVELTKNSHNVKFSCSVEKSEKIYKTVVVGGEVYVVARKQVSSRRKILVIKKYRNVTKSWESVVELEYRKRFAVCNFMNYIFIIGGMKIKYGDMCSTSIRYDKKSKVRRIFAARRRRGTIRRVPLSMGKLSPLEGAFFMIRFTVMVLALKVSITLPERGLQCRT